MGVEIEKGETPSLTDKWQVLLGDCDLLVEETEAKIFDVLRDAALWKRNQGALFDSEVMEEPQRKKFVQDDPNLSSDFHPSRWPDIVFESKDEKGKLHQLSVVNTYYRGLRFTPLVEDGEKIRDPHALYFYTGPLADLRNTNSLREASGICAIVQQGYLRHISNVAGWFTTNEISSDFFDTFDIFRAHPSAVGPVGSFKSGGYQGKFFRYTHAANPEKFPDVIEVGRRLLGVLKTAKPISQTWVYNY